MKIEVKRIYDAKHTKDGTRILVDRLWPRGIAKNDAKLDLWLKELTPSNELRKWFHTDKEGRYKEFTKKYRSELGQNKDKIISVLPKSKKITLITSVKDVHSSHIPTLKTFLEKMS